MRHLSEWFCPRLVDLNPCHVRQLLFACVRRRSSHGWSTWRGSMKRGSCRHPCKRKNRNSKSCCSLRSDRRQNLQPVRQNPTDMQACASDVPSQFLRSHHMRHSESIRRALPKHVLHFCRKLSVASAAVGRTLLSTISRSGSVQPHILPTRNLALHRACCLQSSFRTLGGCSF